MSDCRCHPLHGRCGRCDEQTALAVEILQAKARDDHKECCAHTSEGMVCVIRRGHAGEHRYEPVNRVIPIS